MERNAAYNLIRFRSDPPRLAMTYDDIREARPYIPSERREIEDLAQLAQESGLSRTDFVAALAGIPLTTES